MNLTERFWSRIAKGPSSDSCWLWTGGTNGNGYGRAYVDGKSLYPHRVIYEALVGPIPAGLQIDHLCRNRACVNPAHLEPVTNKENTLRGDRGRLRTHCAQGHEYTPANTYVWNGQRRCRICLNAKRRRHQAKYNLTRGGKSRKGRHVRIVPANSVPFDQDSA